LRQAASHAARADGAALAGWAAAVERQRSALVRRRDAALAQRARRGQALDRHLEAVAEGLARAGAEAEQAARDAVQAADASVAALDERLAALAVSLAERRHDNQRRELERTQALERALAAVEEARSWQALTEVRSPIAGRVESVLVAVGAHVQPGTPLAEVAPAGAGEQRWLRGRLDGWWRG
jgi:multidrug resistance efflux pump